MFHRSLTVRRCFSATVALLLVAIGSITLPITIAPFSLIAVAESRRQDSLWQELHLSASQARQLQTIHDRYEWETKQRRRIVKEEQQRLRALMASDASAEQVRQQYNRVQAARQQYSRVQFDSLLDIRDILNSEQRRTFADIMSHRR